MCPTSGSPTCAANHPIFKHPEPDGPGFWVVTKYDDVVTVGRDGATYSSDQKRGGVVVLEETEMNDFEQGGNLMLTMDSAGAHALPQARQPRVHAAPDAHAGAAHP